MSPRAGAIAIAYCQTVSQGRQAALAGIRHILLNYGWNTGGILSPGSELTLNEAAAVAARFSTQVLRINPEARVLLEGGPVESADDLAFIRSHARLHGYIGGSTCERLPVERSIADRIATFKLSETRLAGPDPADRKLAAFGERAGFVGESPPLLAALAELRAARRLRPPFLYVCVPEGDSLDPVVAALTPSGPRRRALVDLTVDPDLGAAGLRSDLFGEARRRGYLADPDLDLVILRHPERMTRAAAAAGRGGVEPDRGAGERGTGGRGTGRRGAGGRGAGERAGRAARAVPCAS